MHLHPQWILFGMRLDILPLPLLDGRMVAAESMEENEVLETVEDWVSWR